MKRAGLLLGIGLAGFVAVGPLGVLAGCTARTSPKKVARPTPVRPMPPPIERRLDIALRPVCTESGPPQAMDVRVEVQAPPSTAPPVFRISNPTDAEAVQKLLENVAVVDAQGPMTLAPEIRVGADREKRLFFTGDRPAHGKLAITYRARSQTAADPGVELGLRHDDTSIGGTGDGMLILPAEREASHVSLQWFTDGCDPTWSAASAIGTGNGPLRVHAPPDALRQAGFFFGKPETFSLDRDGAHLRFFLYGGKVSFDTAVATKYTLDILHAERALFGDEDPTPFYAFMRVLPQSTSKVHGGGNLYGYTSVVGPAAEWNPRMRNHLAHELMHHWIGVGLWVVDAQKVSGYWFTEGFTVRYARTIALRTGAIAPQEYLDEINRHAAGYYASEVRGASNAEIERGLEDGTGHADLGYVPYWKGGLFADELDGAIRARSGGKRSLDDVMRELCALGKRAPRNAAGYAEVREDAVRAAIEKELGPAGAARFDAVVRKGDIARPAPDALGPCFERRDKKYGEQSGYEWVRTAAPDTACARPATR